jgi:hypothetical protein
MKNNKLFLGLTFALCLFTLAFIVGCGAAPTSSSSGASSTPRVYVGSDSAGGNVSKFILNGNAFSVTVEAGTNVGMYFGGVVRHRYNSGLISAEVTAPGNTLMTGETVYAVEFPNVMLLVSGDNDDIFLLPARSLVEPTYTNCAAIQIPWTGWNYTSNSAYITIEVTGSSPSITFNIWSYLLDGTLDSTPSYTGFSFVDGRYTDGTPGSVQIFTTPAGLFLGNSGSGGNGCIAGGAIQTNITTTDVLGGTYKGIMLANGDSGDMKAVYVERLANTSSFHVFAYADPTIDDHSTFLATFEMTGEQAMGSFPCRYSDDDGTFSSVARMQATRINGGKILLYGISTMETSGDGANFIVYQQ